MPEPLAPPNARGVRRTVAAAPGAAPWSSVGHPERDPTRDAPPRPADVPRHEEAPATPGKPWLVAGAGIGVLCLAHLVRFLAVMDDLGDAQAAPALFAVLGLILLSVGLALAALLQRGLAVPWRIALLLGGGFFAAQGSGWMAFVGFGGF